MIQVAKYLHGVGDSKNFLVRTLGGGIGTGLITRIVRGYTFVSRNFAPGDRIYLIGFSRGAYTARALAGLISAKGLLPSELGDPNDKERAYRAGSAVWYEWRREVLRSRDFSLRNLQEIARDLPHFLHQEPPADLVPAPIEAVAVWDLGALGIPQFDEHLGAVDAFQFADRSLHDNVKFGRHAISIDEQRNNFTPTLWNRDPDPKRIVQVLFPGGHADVGGGYRREESGLSDCALKWMTGELEELGLEIGPPVIPENPDPCGTGHEEWTKLLWQALPHSERKIPDAPELHLSEAVLLRIKGALATPYDPRNISSYILEKLARDNVVVVPLS